MSQGMRQLMAGWGGLAVVSHFDPATDAWIFIALHDATLGVPMGGTRLMEYPTPEDGLLDAMRLAEGMTHKWAAVEFDSGGGKAVLALSRPLQGSERLDLLRRYGQLLSSLNGCFRTGQDLGTTPEDMLAISREAPYVHGCDPEQNVADDPGPYTAHGVLVGIRAALHHLDGSPELRGRSVLVQGTGDVGGPLAGELAEAGATLLLSDLDEERVRKLADDLGASAVEPSRAHATECDIYAPCAVGGTLNRSSIAELRCRIVAGSANTQLGESEDAERLHERGILYAPDYVINAGGAIAFGMKYRGERSEPVIRARIEGIGPSLREIFAEAQQQEVSPIRAAQSRVEQVLSRARKSK